MIGEIVAFLLFLGLCYGFYHFFIKKDYKGGDLPDDIPGRD